MKVTSWERTTGMGARHCTEVATAEGWCRVGDLEGAQFLNRVNGFNVYEIEVEDGTPIRAYHRSNSGVIRIVEGAETTGYW